MAGMVKTKPKDVSELLKVLRANRVEEFEGAGVKVRFSPVAFMSEEQRQAAGNETDEDVLFHSAEQQR